MLSKRNEGHSTSIIKRKESVKQFAEMYLRKIIRAVHSEN
jgi:hypothetical protein